MDRQPEAGEVELRGERGQDRHLTAGPVNFKLIAHDMYRVRVLGKDIYPVWGGGYPVVGWVEWNETQQKIKQISCIIVERQFREAPILLLDDSVGME